MAEEACSLLSKATQIAKFMGPTMGPTWVLSAPDRPHLGPTNLAIRALYHRLGTHSNAMPVTHISVTCNAIIFYAQNFLWTNVECSISMLGESYLSCRTWCRAIGQTVPWANLLPLPTDLLVKQPLGSKRGHFIHLLNIWCIQVLF